MNYIKYRRGIFFNVNVVAGYPYPAISMVEGERFTMKTNRIGKVVARINGDLGDIVRDPIRQAAGEGTSASANADEGEELSKERK